VPGVGFPTWDIIYFLFLSLFYCDFYFYEFFQDVPEYCLSQQITYNMHKFFKTLSCHNAILKILICPHF